MGEPKIGQKNKYLRYQCGKIKCIKNTQRSGKKILLKHITVQWDVYVVFREEIVHKNFKLNCLIEDRVQIKFLFMIKVRK